MAGCGANDAACARDRAMLLELAAIFSNMRGDIQRNRRALRLVAGPINTPPLSPALYRRPQESPTAPGERTHGHEDGIATDVINAVRTDRPVL
jgi:hypothetical protein